MKIKSYWFVTDIIVQFLFLGQRNELGSIKAGL